MEYFKVYERVKPHLVMGENVAQAAQFVSSGAADIGIVALSLAMADPMHSSGRYWGIPPDAYPRIEQGLGILSHARKAGHLDAAYAFRNWIASTDSMVIFAKYGLFPPGKP
jgi:molybdate transport system substrate-binding protein